MIKTSQEFQLIWEDVKKAALNSLVFASPLLLMVLGGLQQGKTWEEMSPLLYAALIQLAIDLIKKYLTKDTYKV